MRVWPVPDSYTRQPPKAGAPGSFWEHRGDRYHCGVDIYAPKGSPVLAVEDGEVLETGVFTSPLKVPYWNTTYYVLIRQNDGLVSRYAEVGEVLVNKGDSVKAGEVIARVGSVLNPDAITPDAPPYIRDLKQNERSCMLHFELFRKAPSLPDHYLGGNLFDPSRPDDLMDAGSYLGEAVHRPCYSPGN